MKRYFTIIILAIVLCIMSPIPQISINAANETITERITIDAYIYDNSIIITVTPEKQDEKNDNSNNGNTMNKTQIWGEYGKGWFLIKDYGNEKGGNQQFVWDLKTLNTDNESYYWDEQSQSFRYVNGRTDLFKVYVKYKKDFSPNDSKDNKVELYKTFYLGEYKQDVQLTTSEELDEYVPVSKDFPVLVTQGDRVELYVDAKEEPELYSVKIIGDNNYIQNVNTIDGAGDDQENKKTFEWIPDECGTFYIAVYDSSQQIVLKRKVYVNSSNDEYLQLNDLSISNENSVVYIRLKVADTRPIGSDENINNLMKIVISEPNVWSKTIKNYGDIVNYDAISDTYEINEERENFSFGSGNYYVTASIKGPHSIEPEDTIGKSYSKSGIDTTSFQMTWRCISGKLNNDGSYSKLGKAPLVFHFEVNECQDNCEYAFFLSDARGKRLVQDYSEDRDFEWSPADPGKYSIFARIRQKGINSNLPNSFEKEVNIEVWVAYPDKRIVLNEIVMNGNKWSVENGEAVLVDIGESIKAHTLNIIEIDAECKGNPEKSSLMYKVSYIDDGHYNQTTPYTFSNYIPFYPRSAGQHSLIVMVKDSISGSWEDQCEILINIEE